MRRHSLGLAILRICELMTSTSSLPLTGVHTNRVISRQRKTVNSVIPSPSSLQIPMVHLKAGFLIPQALLLDLARLRLLPLGVLKLRYRLLPSPRLRRKMLEPILVSKVRFANSLSQGVLY